MSFRVARTQRLVDLCDRAEQAARVRAEVAARKTADARALSEREENAWSLAAHQLSEGVVTVSDLQEQAAYLKTLRLRADAAGACAARALGEERAAAAAVVQAATDRRKLELWRDRVASTERSEEARLDRVEEDAVASRLAASSKR